MLSDFFSLSLSAAFAVVAITAFLLVRSWRNLHVLQELTPVASDEPADCMVVIPARDEQECIARAVKSFPHDTVIVVDDYSTDATAEEARRAGAGVLLAPPLPRGAVGKAHACMVGGRLLTSRWVLFADADTWYDSGFVDSAVSSAQSDGLDFLSVYLTPVAESLAERLLVPYLSSLFFSGASLRRAPASLFSGRCLLVRREAYEFIGGHAPVVEALTEDVKLAALAQRHRMKFSVVRAGKLGHVRLYAGWRGIWSGVERDAFRVAEVSHGTGAIVILTALGTALWIPAVVWVWIDQQRVAAGVLTVLMLALLKPWYGFPRVLMAPAAIYASIPVLFHGLMATITSRRITWKGRVI